ncbi:ABC transporter permease [Kitasatospora sp. NPDC089509]|uniref:ABC transporter permease n=1 Tax=Kitasatospora sp. NPDC089509 TaxID=3364079 RepID=UPI003807F685
MKSVDLAHMKTLFRIEWKLFRRIKGNYVFVVFAPLMIIVAMRFVHDQLDLAAHGLNAAPVMAATATGILLIFSLYSSVTGLYVARREELVLKRLRTGQVSDLAILTGGASMYVVVTVAQIAAVAAAVSVMSGTGVRQPLTALAGLLTGCALMAAMAATTAALCRTAESVMVATLPALFVLPMISGVYLPREVLPAPLGDLLLLAPLSATVDLVRSGWSAELTALDTLARIALSLAWTALFAWIAARRFRWEPRT